jgi:hypothetical protein
MTTAMNAGRAPLGIANLAVALWLMTKGLADKPT